MFCRGTLTFLPPCHHGQSAPPGVATFVPGILFQPRVHFFHSALRMFQMTSGPVFSRLFETFSVVAHVHVSPACDGDHFVPQANFCSRSSLMPRCPCVYTLSNSVSFGVSPVGGDMCITQHMSPPTASLLVHAHTSSLLSGICSFLAHECTTLRRQRSICSPAHLRIFVRRSFSGKLSAHLVGIPSGSP